MAQALKRLLLSPADYNRIEGLINQQRAQQGLPPLISYPVIPPDEAETAFALIEEEAKSSGPLARTAGLFLRLLAWAAKVFPAAVGDDDGDATMGVDVLLEASNDAAVAQAVRDVPVPAPPHQNERPTTVAGRAARKRSAVARSPFATVDPNATAPGAAQPPHKKRAGLRPPRTRSAGAQMDADDAAAIEDDDEDWTGDN